MTMCTPSTCPDLFYTPTPTITSTPTVTPIPTLTPTFTFTPTPTLTPTSLPTPTPTLNYSRFHPVILIHGLGGVPKDWELPDQNYVKLLEDQGYPADYIKEYVYADADNNPLTYDYQGDIPKVSANMKNDVDELSKKSSENGGDGLVDLVGYSLGGLVAREYLHQNPVDHKIRKLITVGTPHQGVFWMGIDPWAENLPWAGESVKEALNNFLNKVIRVVKKHQPLDLNSDAAQEVRPDSSYLQELNNLTMIVYHPKYYTLYGDIDASLYYHLLFLSIKKEFSTGDFFIMPDSAVGIPYSPTSRYGFSDKAALDLNVKGDNDNGFKFEIDWLTADESKYDHLSILKQREVQSTILGILSS